MFQSKKITPVPEAWEALPVLHPFSLERGFETYRCPVPGGWLVLAVVENKPSLTFLPDPKGLWLKS